MIKIAILGYGTVGSGVASVIEENKEMVNKKSAQELEIKYILDLKKFPGDLYENRIVSDYNIILDDQEVTIICETMGGIHPAYEFTKEALLRGKSVCTSNKELVANHGPELLAIAAENQCNYLFEASVGGGIPIIRPLNYSLTAEKIESITGILNGTTNYILSKMEKEGANFEEVLKEAQEKGYAERNPEADVEGHDACRKIAILSSLMTGKHVDFNQIYTEGITKITVEDFRYAKSVGKSIKLLALSKETEGGTLAMVAPCMISNAHPLYMVNDVFNAVCVKGNMLGESMYYGRGAGKLPTASAVVADVIDCARHQGKTIMCFWDKEKEVLVDIANVEKVFFLRAKSEVIEEIKKEFPGGEVVTLEGKSEEFGYFTKAISEKKFAEKYATFGENVLGRIRVEN